jgi:flagellar hook-associated protein 2
VGSLAIDGLVSGLDTTTLINQLMAIESQPQATLAKKTALPATIDLFTASSSASSVSVVAAAGASAGAIDLNVTAVAKAQVAVSAAMKTWPDAPATFTIVRADGSKTELTAASTSLADVATAITASSAGVKATRVAAGTEPGTGDPLYRLQLTAASTGVGGAFQVFRGTAAEVTGGTATDLLAAPGAAIVTTASDASVTLWAGTPAEQVISSASNSFSDILPGVTVTVSKVEASPVTISVARDAAGIGSVASSLVASLSSVLNFIDDKSVVIPTTTSTGGTGTSAGVFTGNSTVRDVRAQVLAAATAPIGGRSPSEIGITITRDGTVTYDSTKFSAALAADPTGTKAMLTTIASRLSTAADTASNQYTGTITQVITGQKSSLSTLDDQISNWDVRLASQRAGLERTYSALEVSLSNLQAQSSWLTSQLAALTASSGTST